MTLTSLPTGDGVWFSPISTMDWLSVTCFYWTDRGGNNSGSLPRLGQKRWYGFHLAFCLSGCLLALRTQPPCCKKSVERRHPMEMFTWRGPEAPAHSQHQPPDMKVRFQVISAISLKSSSWGPRHHRSRTQCSHCGVSNFGPKNSWVISGGFMPLSFRVIYSITIVIGTPVPSYLLSSLFNKPIFISCSS